MTGLQLIRRSLRTIGALASGESLGATEATEAMEVLQGMLDTWRTQRLLCYVIVAEEYPLVSGQEVYTYGPNGGDFEPDSRPVFIDRISAVQNLGDVNTEWEQPLRVIRTAQIWQAIPNKTMQSTWPEKVYIEMDFPLIKLKFWPVYTAGPTLTARIYRWVSIEGLIDMATVYNFAPGYEEALVYNLAVRCAPEFGVAVPPVVQQMADDRMADVKRTNVSQDILILDPTLRRRRWDIYSGTFR